jgi:predicted ferric reductase
LHGCSHFKYFIKYIVKLHWSIICVLLQCIPNTLTALHYYVMHDSDYANSNKKKSVKCMRIIKRWWLGKYTNTSQSCKCFNSSVVIIGKKSLFRFIENLMYLIYDICLIHYIFNKSKKWLFLIIGSDAIYSFAVTVLFSLFYSVSITQRQIRKTHFAVKGL